MKTFKKIKNGCTAGERNDTPANPYGGETPCLLAAVLFLITVVYFPDSIKARFTERDPISLDNWCSLCIVLCRKLDKWCNDVQGGLINKRV